MLFGAAKIITEHIHTGEEYDNVKKVYSVNILYFDLGHGDDYIYHGTTNFIGTHTNNGLELNKKQQEFYKKDKIKHIYPEYYLIKVNKFNDIAKDTLDEWIYFLKHESIKDTFKAKGLTEAKEKLDTMRLSPSEMKEYDRYIEDNRYRNSMVSSNFKMGKIEGIAIGEEIGIEKGKLEGKQEGRLEGEAKAKAELIKQFLASGMSITQCSCHN
jgi:predicted transposase/invertase (TIGR01784 family)